MSEYRWNALGDIWARADGDVVTPIDPSSFGWQGPSGKNDVVYSPEDRLPVEALHDLPGMTVEEAPTEPLGVGPRAAGSCRYGRWPEGAAPPAAVLSKDGDGTLAYTNRLSEAVALVREQLPRDPSRSPMLIDDFVQGRSFRITYVRPNAAGHSTVYLLDDGYAVKVGITSGLVADRVAALQTGNPRRIQVVAEIIGVRADAEVALQTNLAEWNCSGEWFTRSPVRERIAGFGGVTAWVSGVLGVGDYRVELHPGGDW